MYLKFCNVTSHIEKIEMEKIAIYDMLINILLYHNIYTIFLVIKTIFNIDPKRVLQLCLTRPPPLSPVVCIMLDMFKI